MGYLDYTLQKLNAINQMNEQRYREKRLEEETKSQFLNSLVGLVPQAISGMSDAADKRALEEDALNKLRLQEALLTGGDNTLAGVRPLTGANTLAQTAKGPVVAAPAAANTFGFVNTPIEEEDNSLPGSERLTSSGSDGGEGPPTDTSPGYNPYAELSGTIEPVAAANKPYSITGGIVPGSIRRLESAAKPGINISGSTTEKAADMLIKAEKAAEDEAANEAAARAKGFDSYLDYKLKTQYPIDAGAAAKPGINISGSTTEAEPNNIESSFDIAQALAGLGVSAQAPPAAEVVAQPVLDPNRDLGKSSFDVSAPLSKLGPFSQAKLAGAKEAMRDADIKAAAAKQAPLPLPAPAPTSLLPMTGRGGPAMPGAVGDENVPDESSKAYRKRMEKKGYSTQKINDLSKKYFGSSTGTIDIADETGTAGGPRGAKPFQIGGDNPPTFSGGGSGGFGGAPVAGKPWIKEKKVIPEGEKPAVVVPEVPQLSVTEQLRNEEKDRQDALNKRLVNYKRLTNDDFKEPDIDKLAEKAVSEIFTKRPPGNPISEMLNNITGAGQMTAERERLMRSIAKKTIIKNIKAERKAIADADAESFINNTKLEIDSAFKAGKTLGLQTSKKQIPDSARRELDSQEAANLMLNDVRDEAYQIAAETGTLPVGKTRFMTEARINEIASKTGMSGKALSAGFLGASLGGSKSQAGPFVDPDLLVKAFKATDFSDLSPKEQNMVQLMTRSIQILGKALEGGKLTDADYNKYVSTLFNSDNPAAFIASLEDLIDRNAARYNKNLVYFNKNYGDDLSMFDAAGRREQEFELDWNQIQEKPLSAAAAAVGGGGSGKKKNPKTPPPPPKVDSDF